MTPEPSLLAQALGFARFARALGAFLATQPALEAARARIVQALAARSTSFPEVIEHAPGGRGGGDRRCGPGGAGMRRCRARWRRSTS